MLALTRRIGEKIVIRDGDKVICTLNVVQVNGDKVRMSFDAPTHIKINRTELDEIKQREARR